MSFPPNALQRYLLVIGGVGFAVACWISLFAAGIVVDSEYYRGVISPGGVVDLENEERPVVRESPVELALADSLAADQDTLLLTRAPGATGSGDAAFRIETGPSGASGLGRFFWAIWAFLVVVVSFTPSNLALLCCTAGVLGAMGRRMQLSAEVDPDTLDRTYPYLSAILRGFFVFLVVISGVLVLIEDPILSTSSPEQYVRFGGLLSLTSFVINYDPSLFAMLLDQVRDRLEEREDVTTTGE